jgi:outer membrane protein TolC
LLAQYQQTVLLALEDTENALVRYSNTHREDEHLERAAAESTRAAQLARTQFQAGTIGLYEVLDAERVQLQAQDAFADGRTRGAMIAIALYKALAGGWPQPMKGNEALLYKSRAHEDGRISKACSSSGDRMGIFESTDTESLLGSLTK